MDNHWAIQFVGEQQLLAEGGLLEKDQFTRLHGILWQVEKVESDLTEGDGRMRWHEKGAQLAHGGLPVLVDIAGVQAYGVVDRAGVAGVHLAVGHPIAGRGAHRDESAHTRGLSAVEHGLKRALIFEALQVAVTIYEFHEPTRLSEFHLLESANYLRRMPSVRMSSEIINTQGIYYLGCEEENTLFDAFGSIY